MLKTFNTPFTCNKVSIYIVLQEELTFKMSKAKTVLPLCKPGCPIPASEEMVACSSGDRCLAGEDHWWHFQCVGISKECVPTGDWFCEDCRPIHEKAESYTLQELQEEMKKLELEKARAKYVQMQFDMKRGSSRSSPDEPVQGAEAKFAARNRSDPESGYNLLKLMEEIGYHEDDMPLFGDVPRHTAGKRSGFHAKAASEIILPQRWPQSALRMEAGQKGLGFLDLKWHQFIAGELEINLKCEDAQERKGRLQLLKELVYFMPDADFPVLRTWYFEYLRGIETGELEWGANPMPIGERLLAQARQKNGGRTSFTAYRPSNSGSQSTSNPVEPRKVWYCSRFQRNECFDKSPHKTMVRGVMREVHHYCASCLLRSDKQLVHPDSSPACPHMQARSDGAQAE